MKETFTLYWELRDTAVQLGVLTLSEKVGINTVREEAIVQKYRKCFERLEKLKNFQLTIPIDQNVKSVVQPLRRVPFTLRDKLEKKLDELVNLDVTGRAEGPTPWISLVVVVPKSNGDLRVFVYMRQANSAAKRERDLITTLDEVLHDRNGSTVFTKLAVKWPFYQTELSDDSRPITTFTMHKGLFRYKRLMFGVSCSPEMHQRLIQQVFIDDDIIVHGETGEDDLKRL